MSEIVGAVCMSHAPFWDPTDIAQTAAATTSGGSAFNDAVFHARAGARTLRPTVVVAIGPDHFRNFFYDAMPSFCIGTERVTSYGDFRTYRGDLPAAPDFARALAERVRAGGFDPAISLHMGVDHGIAQAYAALFPALDVAVVPVMLACTGAAMPSVARSVAFGQTLGIAIRSVGNERVLVIGSGGLSHWLPPTDPDHPAIDPTLRNFVIDGRPAVREFQAAREERLMAMAASLSGRVNETWDQWFLDKLASGVDDELAGLTTGAIETDGGNGGQEIRTWLAAAAAWDGPFASTAYEPRPDWLTGMGCATTFA